MTMKILPSNLAYPCALCSNQLTDLDTIVVLITEETQYMHESCYQERLGVSAMRKELDSFRTAWRKHFAGEDPEKSVIRAEALSNALGIMDTSTTKQIEAIEALQLENKTLTSCVHLLAERLTK